MLRKESGFTLIELLVVIAIIAIPNLELKPAGSTYVSSFLERSAGAPRSGGSWWE